MSLLEMPWQAWLSIFIVAFTLCMLAFTRKPADLILLGGLTVLLVAGVLSPNEALAGFGNEGLVTVAVLFVVAGGLQETGAMHHLVQYFLGRPKSTTTAQARMMSLVMSLSAFLNNTPLVALFIPAVKDWAKRLDKLSVSKLMIPLSYAAILGGTCTLIGTSTNLVVNGMLISMTDHPGLGLFDIAWVGVPLAMTGLIYVLIFSRWLLPDRIPAMEKLKNPREYTVEMIVEPGSAVVGKTIEKAGLRNLPGAYLMEIDRDGHILAAVSPAEVLQANDRLVFTGIVTSVVDLQKIRGLKPATEQVFKLNEPRRERCLIEAVVSNSCPLVGRTIKEGRFRTQYNAVVIAVARNGERIEKKIGDIELKVGDTLLLETSPAFVSERLNSRDFFLVRQVEGSNPPRHEKAWIAWSIFIAMILSVGLEWISMLKAGMLAAGLMIITKCFSTYLARKSIDLRVLLVIAAAFGIGKALEKTGAAAAIAKTFLSLAGDDPMLLLVAVYALTCLLTELITNNAAAVIMFPFALAMAQTLGLNFLPFAVAIMFAASASFSTPIGYQTNMMVYGPGGYRFGDFLRFGMPLHIATGIISLSIIPRVWPF
jgi:di/tricarboxylate transporter